LFFAVVRFSPPSQEHEVAKRKLKAKNNSPDSQEPTFHVWLRLSDVKPRWVNSWFQLFGCGQRLCCVLSAERRETALG